MPVPELRHRSEAPGWDASLRARQRLPRAGGWPGFRFSRGVRAGGERLFETPLESRTQQQKWSIPIFEWVSRIRSLLPTKSVRWHVSSHRTLPIRAPCPAAPCTYYICLSSTACGIILLFAQLATPPLMQTESQPCSRLVRAIRCFYYGGMIIGFPLWLLVAVVLVAWIRFIIWPVPDIGPVEYPSSSVSQLAALRVAGIAYFFAYPAAFFRAYRVTRYPWIVFSVMLVPVLVFCYAVDLIADSNAEERIWFTYLGTLAFILASGGNFAFFADRVHSDQPTSV